MISKKNRFIAGTSLQKTDFNLKLRKISAMVDFLSVFDEKRAKKISIDCLVAASIVGSADPLEHSYSTIGNFFGDLWLLEKTFRNGASTPESWRHNIATIYVQMTSFFYDLGIKTNATKRSLTGKGRFNRLSSRQIAQLSPQQFYDDVEIMTAVSDWKKTQ